MFRLSLNLPQVMRRRADTKRSNKDLEPVGPSTNHSYNKPHLRLSTTSQPQHTLHRNRSVNRRCVSWALPSTSNHYSQLLGPEPEIVDIEPTPRRPAGASSYHREEYVDTYKPYSSLCYHYDPYNDETDYYDGDRTPIATRQLIIEAPRRARSRSRSLSSASRSARSSSARSTASMSTVRTRDSSTSARSDTPSLISVRSASSSSSRASGPSLSLSSRPSRSTITTTTSRQSASRSSSLSTRSPSRTLSSGAASGTLSSPSVIGSSSTAQSSRSGALSSSPSAKSAVSAGTTTTTYRYPDLLASTTTSSSNHNHNSKALDSDTFSIRSYERHAPTQYLSSAPSHQRHLLYDLDYGHNDKCRSFNRSHSHSRSSSDFSRRAHAESRLEGARAHSTTRSRVRREGKRLTGVLKVVEYAAGRRVGYKKI